MTEQEIEIEDLRADLTETCGKLFEAGRFAGQQQLTIDRQGRAITDALLCLEQAHQAGHRLNLVDVLKHLAQAMAILADGGNDEEKAERQEVACNQATARESDR